MAFTTSTKLRLGYALGNYSAADEIESYQGGNVDSFFYISGGSSANSQLGIGATPRANTLIDITCAASTFQQVVITAYGANGAGFRGRGANGTAALPTAATANKSLISLSATGYGDTQFSAASVALIDLQANGTFTDTSNPTFIRFATTPVSSVTRSEVMRLNSTGNVLIGSGTDDTVNRLQVTGGNVGILSTGSGLAVKSGSNCKLGTVVLVGGAATVSNTSVTANSLIFVTSQVDGGTPGFLRVTAKTASTSFVITSSSGTDTSTVAWMIVESI